MSDHSPKNINSTQGSGARGSASSAHAPPSSASPPTAASTSVRRSAEAGTSAARRDHQGSASNSSPPVATVDPSQAMNNLQHLIKDMKSQQLYPSGIGGTTGQQDLSIARHGERDVQASLAALGDRLAAQEEQLQTQLQQQLNLQAHNARTGGLPSVGENAEMEPDAQQQHSLGGHIGPRFAGNAAFQSAMARHSQGARQSSQDLRSCLAHQRQLSLQGRFAELGYSTSSFGNLSTIAGGDYEDASTDDGSSIADFMGSGGFDPTRKAQQSQQQSQQHSTSFGQQGSRFGHGSAASMSGAFPSQPDYVAEQMALQQQIEMLQLQQQQLLQQQVNFNPSVQLGGQPQQDRASHSFGVTSGHRRIQSHAPQSGIGAGSGVGCLSNFNIGGIGSIGSLASAAPINSQAPRGHGRRHSVNVIKGGGGNNPAADANISSDSFSQARPGFSFPNNGHQHQGQLPPQQSYSRTSGHFSHPSLQLSSSLSPEYLMAGGGLLNLSNFGIGSELADGFGGGGAGAGAGMGRVGHSRTGSQSWRINGALSGAPIIADLAQAQAQLASLHQFRSQAGAGGGGHSKHPSFSGGFTPALMGQPPFGAPFGGSSGFGPGGHQASANYAAAQRKALFGSYLPQASLPPLLAAGKIVVGQIRVDKRNRSDAYVSTEILDSDIYISGSRDRNRALSGDIVAVELLDPQEVWLNKKAKEDKKKHKEEQGTTRRKPDKAKDDLEVEGAQLRLIDEEEDTEQAPPALAGHVVAIVERTPGQLFCGTIGLLRPSSAATKEKQQQERALREGGGSTEQPSPEQQQRPKIVWHRPLNKTTPLIAIPADQAPAAFWEPGGQEKYATIMVTVAIKRWPITSLHPFGTLVEEIGVMGNVEAETQAILKDNLSTATEDFSESALKCVPPFPYAIPDREYEVRRDFRDECVFTIDPPMAKDLDDAVCVRRLDGGLLEIGVHIADVSHFVKLNSALDRDARKRCTSVYLVQRAIPMLPPALSEQLCSLVPGVERLCFSAVFTMNKDARILDSWFGRTIIKSCAQLAYSDAQCVIDDGSLPAEKEIQRGHDRKRVAEDIKILHDLAQIMRRRRFDEGALSVENVKLNFRLDDNGLPADASAAQGREANHLIEEFMLTANTAVSQRIAAGLPDTALLRRHAPPLERRLEGFQRRAEQMGFHVDISSAGALYDSLRSIGEKDLKSRFALETLATKSMLRAKYFCAGMTDISKYSHYALNVPLYTHFTSPIRRYADVMVHRQLDAVLQGQDKFGVDREGIAKIAQQCNVKRDAAKFVQEQSQHLFLCLLVHDLTVRYGPVVRQATVIGVLDAAFDIVVPEFGIEKRVHVDQMPIQHHTYDGHDNSLSIYWRSGVDTISWLAETSDDPHVKALRERARQQRAAAGELSSQSRQDEASLFDDDDDDCGGDGGRSAVLAEARRRLLSGEDAKDSVQRTKSRGFREQDLIFEGVGARGGSDAAAQHHKIQTIKTLQTVPVVMSASVGSKSPPVLTVFAVNPFALS